MTEKTVSQVREAQSAWKKAVDDHISRTESAFGEIARMQEQGLEQSRNAVDEMAKLTKDSINYYAQLSAEWRKLTLEATKKAVDFVSSSTPKG
jgi:methyl-accepting chemotaxis protein